MSGTSLDGLDIAFCSFEKKNKYWYYQIRQAETIIYDNNWRRKLLSACELSNKQLSELHDEYGDYLGTLVNKFIHKHNSKIDLIASHGHTVFHQPEKKLTLQIGNGNRIACKTEIPVVYDFRSKNVELGGQGAPLVPIGDRLLFHKYEYCLNLGGFSNISFEKDGERVANDICPVNIALNYLANKSGFTFDKDGKQSSQGKTNDKLLSDLNYLEYYKKPYPKSLGREWFEKSFKPLIDIHGITLVDILRTVTEHIAIQIKINTKQTKGKKILLTGGGAYNSFLVERIQAANTNQVVIPGKTLIDFKEALIFAFMGLLKIKGEINCLASATGASKDISAGVICGV